MPSRHLKAQPSFLNRRGFLIAGLHMGSAVALAPLLEACQRAGLPTPALSTESPTSPPSSPFPKPAASRTPGPTRPPRPTPTVVPSPVRPAEPSVTRVALVRTHDRSAGVARALDLLEADPLRGQRWFLKPNFNSADPAPGSTHPDVLSTLAGWLNNAGMGRLTVGDRSGMGDTRTVMGRKGIFQMGDELGFDTLVLDELEADAWEHFQVPGGHWQRGFALPRPALAADGFAQACCLKTHRFGGHFTLSLKNSVGLAAKWVPGEGYNYMNELHSSPHQRRMIAEINAAYRCDLIVLDGVEAFVQGGPERGRLVSAGVVLAGTNRVAVDSVGVAILRSLGTTPEVSQGPVFRQQQIARAVKLGLGVDRPDRIELVTGDEASREFAQRLTDILLADGAT